MSVEAISWALNLAPVPTDRGGQPSSTCKFVLVGLANHAGPDGTDAFPSVATLVRYTALSERTVRTCLDRLAAEGIISPCDPDIVAARIKRADRRPQGWDLNRSLVRKGLDAATAVLEHQFPGLGARLAAAAQPVAEEPSVEPSAAAAPVREASTLRWQGGGPIGEFFAALGDAWILTPEQRARLAPAVEAALSSRWTPAELAAFTGANTEGVRNRFAVLTARLSPAELPPPPGQRPALPPWCGKCDQVTRMLGFNGDAPRPCPRCKPAAAASRASPAMPLACVRTRSSAPPLLCGHRV
ncbi:MAG TPA: helix-turn-helix domain-containing protein [Streptosporangiaceae bacterium]